LYNVIVYKASDNKYSEHGFGEKLKRDYTKAGENSEEFPPSRKRLPTVDPS